MFTAQQIDEFNRIEELKRRHHLRAEAYAEAKLIVNQLMDGKTPFLSARFKPVHLYMHVLPGFNTYFEPAKYTGWRKLRMIDVDTDLDNSMNVRFALSSAWLTDRKW